MPQMLFFMLNFGRGMPKDYLITLTKTILIHLRCLAIFSFFYGHWLSNADLQFLNCSKTKPPKMMSVCVF